MSIVNLPKWLEPAGEFDLVRLGRDCDGGYLVEVRDVADADVLISLGINDDWSFEEDFLQRRDIPLHAFDGTVDRGIFGRSLIRSLFSRHDIKYRFKVWREYPRFFSGTRHHHKKMVGLKNWPGFTNLQDIFAEYSYEKAFLKIDVEGWEYRLFQDILTLSGANRICGLIIEVHNVDLHGELLREFVEKIPLRIAHIHRNTYAPISDDGVPLVLEITFTPQAPVTANAVKLPHALDRPSAPDHEPSEIRFAG